MTEQLGPTRAQSNASSGGFRLSFPLVPVRVMGLFDESGELHPDECLSFPRQTAGCLLHREDFRTSEPRYPNYPHLLPPLSSLDCTTPQTLGSGLPTQVRTTNRRQAPPVGKYKPQPP